jgi:hypothetical protein
LEDNIKMDLVETSSEHVDYFHLVQDGITWRRHHENIALNLHNP